jgi:alkanesulfonate monooxygenase SsuD/methylene tetrahydromethanopterin reductase-like flavin-dependent oxidoreductase (luciferase family)
VIVLPLHNPVLVAEEAAMLDVLSGGRMEVDVGSGRIGRINAFFSSCRVQFRFDGWAVSERHGGATPVFLSRVASHPAIPS